MQMVLLAVGLCFLFEKRNRRAAAATPYSTATQITVHTVNIKQVNKHLPHLLSALGTRGGGLGVRG